MIITVLNYVVKPEGEKGKWKTSSQKAEIEGFI